MSILDEVTALKSAADKGALVQEEAAKNLAAELDDSPSTSANLTAGQDASGVYDYHAEDLMGQYAEIPLEFERTWGADPEQIEGIVQRLLRVSQALRDDVIDNEINLVMDFGTAGWDSAAGRAYRGFITPLSTANRNQLLLVDSMIVALRSNQEVLSKAHGDIDAIATQTIRALRNGWDEFVSDGAAEMLFVVNLLAAATLAAVPAIGPAAAAGPLSVAASVAGTIWGEVSKEIGSNLPAEGADSKPTDFKIGAHSSYTSDIVSDMYEALGQVRTAVETAEQDLANALQAAYDLYAGSADPALFEPRRPGFADAQPSELTGGGPNGFGSS